MPGFGLGSIFGMPVDDWHSPQPWQFPHTSDISALPPHIQQSLVNELFKSANIPLGSLYSPSRNAWKTPAGKILPAGDFRPLPLDANTIDSQTFMNSLEQRLRAAGAS